MKIKKIYENTEEYYKILGYEHSMIDYLTLSYQLWSEAEGLEPLSADEHDKTKLTHEQRIYLEAFEKLWDITLDLEYEYYKDDFIVKLNAKKYNL